MASTQTKSFPTRPGQQGGDEFELFLKMYAGEVLTSFDRTNIMRPLLRERTITSGKSAQFPAIGVATSQYYVPGENILMETGATTTASKYLSDIPTGEKVINLDFPLLSNVLITNVDDFMTHFEVRAEMAKQQGEELARKWDLSLLQVVFNGSEQAAEFSANGGSFGKGGIQLTNATFESTPSSALTTMADAAKRLTENEIPQSDRHFIVRPDLYYKLSQLEHVSSGDYNPGGSNSEIEGRVLKYMGFNIWQSNRFTELRALGNHAAVETGQRGSDYLGDFSNCVGVFFHKQAAGTVRRAGIELESERVIEYQSQLMVAKYMVGHGVLHEAACGSVITA